MKKKFIQQKMATINTGRWTHTENKKFMTLLQKYGKDWRRIQQKMKNRTLSQIRSHYQNVFLQMSKEDIEAFIGIQQRPINDWKKMIDRNMLKRQRFQVPQKQKCEQQVMKSKEQENQCQIIAEIVQQDFQTGKSNLKTEKNEGHEEFIFKEQYCKLEDDRNSFPSGLLEYHKLVQFYGFPFFYSNQMKEKSEF